MKWRPAALGLALLLGAVSGVSAGEPAWHGKAFHPPRVAHEFKLTRADGSAFSLTDERGSVVLLCFGFVRCPSVCPAILANLAAVRREMPAENRGRVKVVFVSVDPKDGPAALAGYLPLFDKEFIGLSGTREKVAEVARAYGATFKEAPASGPEALIDHTTDTLVIDPEGRLRLSYSMDQLRDHGAVEADLSRVLGK